MKWFLFALGLVLSSAARSSTFGSRPSDVYRVPAHTAYIEPDAEAVKVSEAGGVTGWADAKEKVVWYGILRSDGRLDLSVSLRLPKQAVSQLRLTVANQSLIAKAEGGGSQPVTVSFGSVDIPRLGRYRFALAGLSRKGATFGDPEALLLSGPAAQEARFNLTASRGAPSVHLWYPVPSDASVEWFYNEVTVKTDPIWSYYMACGFSRGYFGIQVNSPTERRIIFSVWDSGKEPVDRNKVSPDDRVQLLAKGNGVFAGGFGNEGTGGHSHLVYPWKTGRTYRFLVSARPDGTHTIYSGYFYFPERKRWDLVASFRAPKDGGYLKGLYSFDEDFNGANGQKQRLAEFGNQWIKTADGRWTELRVAQFTHTSDGYTDHPDRGAGVTDGRFYLTTGGGDVVPIHYGDMIERLPTGRRPDDITLPSLP